jgi:hypothetical protein
MTSIMNRPVAIQLSAYDKDIDDLTADIVSDPLHVTLSEINQDTGVVTYTPNPGFVGTDEFTFKVNDVQLIAAVQVLYQYKNHKRM